MQDHQIRILRKFCQNREFFLIFFLNFRLSDPVNRASYDSCLQNSMSIISSVIDYQVEHLKHNINTTNNPFASKLLIKVCIDFLLQSTTNIKAPICLRCLKSLAKVIEKRNFFFISFDLIKFFLGYTWTFNFIRIK